MSTRIAIGIGCRRRCPANAIETLINQALSRTPDAETLGLFTIHDKNGEPGLIEAASHLGLPLVFLSRETLYQQAPLVQTRSSRTRHLFGIPSVAEAAALAGAGAGAALIIPRIASQHATCAVAEARVQSP